MPLRKSIWVCDMCGMGSTYNFDYWTNPDSHIRPPPVYCDDCHQLQGKAQKSRIFMAFYDVLWFYRRTRMLIDSIGCLGKWTR